MQVNTRITSNMQTDSASNAYYRRVLIVTILAVLAVGFIAFFIGFDLPKARQYALEKRSISAAGLAVVGIAIGCSTVVFQTITSNKILTPSLMGFDAMYVLIQTVIVYTFGSVFLTSTNSMVMFAVNTAAMMGFTVLLFSVVFSKGRLSLDLLLLIGIVVGVFFRSVSSLLQRMIDPGEYQVLQDRFFAKFSFVDQDLLKLSVVITVLVVGVLWWRRRTLDVLLLGKDPAISLGVNYRREVIVSLLLCSVLVSVSTALVGPVTFFGLLVANLAYVLMRSDKHSWTIPTSCLLGVVSLVGGQWILSKVFDFNTSLSVIIEFVGGLLFLYLLLSKKGLAR